MEFEHLKKFNRLLPKIPRQKGTQIVTRFPPEPSGYLHLGHLKAIVLNYALAKKYGGRCLLRFDDTNPKTIDSEYEQVIREDLERIGFQPDGPVTYSSDYFGRLLEVADQLVATGDAYVDETPPEDISRLRRLGVESEYRQRPTEAHVVAWEWLKEGKLHQACLRLKIKMDHHYNPMRDPVIYRLCLDADGRAVEHPRWGGAPVYPTYDFACPLIDSWEGVTHALRSDEYFDRDPLYRWMLQKLERPPIHLVEFSRLMMAGTLMSKRKLRQVIQEKLPGSDQPLVTGWDDPRMPTLRGLLARGATPEAMIKFVADQGLAHHNVVLDWTKLWTFNKQVLDMQVPRYTALEIDVSDEDVVSKNLVILHLGEIDWSLAPVEVPKHPRLVDMGTKNLGLNVSACQYVMEQYGGWFDIWIEEDDARRVQEGQEVTLLYWGNVVIDKISWSSDELVSADRVQLADQRPRVIELWGRHRPRGDATKTAWKWTWLPATGFNDDTTGLVQGWIYRYRYLLSVDQVPDGDDWRDYWDTRNWQRIPILCEPAVLGQAEEQVVGTQIQFQRKGFYRRAKPDPADGRPVWIEHVFFPKKK